MAWDIERITPPMMHREYGQQFAESDDQIEAAENEEGAEMLARSHSHNHAWEATIQPKRRWEKDSSLHRHIGQAETDGIPLD